MRSKSLSRFPPFTNRPVRGARFAKTGKAGVVAVCTGSRPAEEEYRWVGDDLFHTTHGRRSVALQAGSK